jgi:serine/threonine protein kinase
MTSQLEHPNTIAIYDYGRTPEGVFYYAMEYLAGINLEDLVLHHGPLPEGRVIYLLQQVCGSLAEAHGIGLIHRDVKPANIVISHRGGLPDFVKVLDFGLVKAVGGDVQLTSKDVVVGTPLYVAPEAIEHPEKLDLRADIYAVGAVGYYLLTGSPVFAGRNTLEICRKHLKDQPQRPSERLARPVSADLEAVILRCLAKAPSERPTTAALLAQELSRCTAAAGWTRADAEKWWKTRKESGPPPGDTPRPAGYTALRPTRPISS